MSLDAELDDSSLKVRQSVRYFLNEHGKDAIVEAEAALRYAVEVNDQDTVDVFRKVLTLLSELHSE